MTHAGEPVGDSGALLSNLLENPRAAVPGNVVVALHVSKVDSLQERRLHLNYRKRGAKQWRSHSRLPLCLRLCSWLGFGFRTTSGTFAAEESTDTPGSPGGSRAVTPTLARTWAALDRRDPAR